MERAELYTSEPQVEYQFTEEQWTELVDSLSTVFKISPSRKNRILNNKVMKLTAAIPYAAGCRNPKRVSLSHLAIYLLAATQGGKQFFQHGFHDNDDLFSRLERISHFDGGNEIIINRGMNMLALAMLEDHITDAPGDRAEGKYNPINEGFWNYEKLSAALREKITSVPCKTLDSIMNINSDIPGYWDS